jgi:hypothetical protein
VAVKIYLVVNSDRHSDDEYAAFASETGAVAKLWCDQARAEEHYNTSAKKPEVIGWMHYWTVEDCASGHIEVLKVGP